MRGRLRIRRTSWIVPATLAAAASLVLPAAASAGVCGTYSNTNDIEITESPLTTSGVSFGGAGGAITDLDVNLEIIHPNPHQLAIYLQLATNPVSPPIELSSGNGSNGENYTGTILDDEGLNPIAGASAPFTGRYRPETPLSTFDGRLDSGHFTLTVAEGGDPVDPDTGYIDSWGVTVSSDACGGPDPSECEEAKAALKKAKAKLRRLKENDAARSKIRAAKRRVEDAKAAVDEACAT